MKKGIKFLGLVLVILSLTFCENKTSVDTLDVIANFNIATDSILKGDTILFDNLSENGISYLWDFGTGETSTEESPYYIFDTVGIFSVVLFADGKNGSEDSISKTLTVGNDISIITPENFWDTAEDIEMALLEAYQKTIDLTSYQYLLDAVYTNQVDISDSQWTALYLQQQDSYNSIVRDYWSDSYSAIASVNVILDNIENINSEIYNIVELEAQLKTLRAYVYMHLVNWFGNVPLVITQSEIDFYPSRTDISEIIDFFIDELSFSEENLPLTWTDSDNKVSCDFSKLLLAKFYTLKKENKLAYLKLKDIINSQNYALDADTLNTTQESSELIFGIKTSSLQDGVIKNLFESYIKIDFLPVGRFTEIILLFSELSNELYGPQGEAMNYLNLLLARGEQELLSPIVTKEEFKEKVFEQWLKELNTEGVLYLALKRLNREQMYLTISDYQSLLPIPQSEVDLNPNMTQNPGY